METKKNVLVFGRNPRKRIPLVEMARKHLGESGDVIEAHEVTDLRAISQQSDIALALVECDLTTVPGVTSLDVAAVDVLRASSHTLPIYAISSQIGTCRAAKKQGATGYFFDTFNRDYLPVDLAIERAIAKAYQGRRFALVGMTNRAYANLVEKRLRGTAEMHHIDLEVTQLSCPDMLAHRLYQGYNDVAVVDHDAPMNGMQLALLALTDMIPTPIIVASTGIIPKPGEIRFCSLKEFERPGYLPASIARHLAPADQYHK